MSAYPLKWIESRIDEIEARVGRWLDAPSWAGAPVLQTFAGNNMYTDVRTSERSFVNQMACIETTLKAKTDWMPFLEPWHGVGVYANLFGCAYDWTVCDYPQTRYAVTTAEEARRLTKPDWRTGRDLPAGDGFHPVLPGADRRRDPHRLHRHPEPDRHRDAHLADRQLLPRLPRRTRDRPPAPRHDHRRHHRVLARPAGGDRAQPGPGAQRLPVPLAGPYDRIGLSDDLATVVSPAVYEEFSRPYNERIAAALGGVVIHSCGVWRPPIMKAVLATKGLAGIELALSVDDDPSPSAPEVVRDGFAGCGLPVKARVGKKFLPAVERVYHPELRFIPQIAWDDDPAVRDRNYETLHAHMAQVGAR